MILKWPEMCQKIPPIPLHHQHQLELLKQGKIDPWLHSDYPQIQTLQTKRRSRTWESSDRATFFQFSIVQFWWARANSSLSFSFFAEMSGTQCGPICFKDLHLVHSEILGWNNWSFEILLPFYHLERVWPSSWHSGIFTHRSATEYFLFFRLLLYKHKRRLSVKIPIDQQFHKCLVNLLNVKIIFESQRSVTKHSI